MSKIGNNKKEISSVIKRPHVTEKSSYGSTTETPSYTFIVDSSANKKTVKDAVKKLYGVTPVRVNITMKPTKAVFSRGKSGNKPGYKKAVVCLKKGDKIEFV